MKKSLIAMMAVALFVTSAMAQVLIYDYSASFKDLSIKTVKNVKAEDGTKVTIDSAKVASDKFTGYVVIEACEDCTGDMEYSTASDNYALVYVTSKSVKGAAYRVLGTFRANMFGAKSGYVTPRWVGKDKFTDASGILSYDLDWDKVSNTGFLGFDNYMAAPTQTWNGGYGKVQNNSWTIDYGCYTETETCYMVKNLSGAFASETNYTGFCSEILFDICSLDVDQLAPLPGTFSLKLNNKLTFTNKQFNYADFVGAEAAVINALKTTVILVPETDDAPAELGVAVGEYWEE